MNNTDKIKITVVVAAIGAGILLVIFGGLSAYHALVFRVTSTNPNANNVSNVSPFFNISFSQQLSPTGLSVTSSPAMIKSYSVSGSTLDIVARSPMNTGQKYTVTVNSITSKSGKHLTNLHFTFTPKNIPLDSLPADQQQAAQQQQEVYEENVTNYTGTSALTTIGVTDDQISTLEQAFYTFAQKQEENPKTVSINASSVSPEAFVQDSPSSAVDFTVSFDSTSYKAHLVYYSDLTSIELTLANPTTGATVYDSGVLGQSQ